MTKHLSHARHPDRAHCGAKASWVNALTLTNDCTLVTCAKCKTHISTLDLEQALANKRALAQPLSVGAKNEPLGTPHDARCISNARGLKRDATIDAAKGQT
jgi:hypothetical protein